jgi:hypothetical protein
VARAKSTDRAEARRRYRQTLTAEEAAALDDGDASSDGTAIPAAARANRPPAPKAAGTATAAAVRPSLITTLRASLQPAPIKEDLRALPQVVLRTKAFIVPAALSVASGAAFLLVGQESNFITVLGFQAFVYPPPMAVSFLGGLLAPRASWAVGGLLGLVASIVFIVVVLVYPESAAAGGTGAIVSATTQRQDAVLFALVTSPTIGMAVGAFAGFYRRFLRNSGAGQSRSKSQKKAASRR